LAKFREDGLGMAGVTLIALVSLLVLAFVGVALFVLWGVTFWTG
jgi:hypothetical protein